MIGKIINYFLNKDWILNIVMYFLSEEKQEKIYILKIRQSLECFGCDTSEMTDEDIKSGMKELNRTIKSSGISVSEATRAIRLLSTI